MLVQISFYLLKACAYLHASVGVLVLVLVLEYNSSTCKYSARTRLSVLEIYLDLARTRLFILEFCMYSKVKYSVLSPSTRGYNSSTALNHFPRCIDSAECGSLMHAGYED